MKQLTHLSLFSGIGGLDLAAEWAGFKTVGQCEFAEYQTKVLETHWPDVERWKDIHDLSADEFYRRTGVKDLTCISGGFPCQPHSVAGKRKASSDERDLWPEYRRIIGEIKPRWVVAENVRGLITSEDGRFFRGILGDFADLGYDVGWCCFRAADVGAIHRRERIGIIAYSNQNGFGRRPIQVAEEKHERNEACNYPGSENLLTVWRKDQSAICRTDDGAAGWVDRIGALGNMVVPQQFYLVYKAIANIENR